MSGEGTIKSAERTVLRAGGSQVELTYDDALRIQQALLDYLQQSSYPDRDELLKWSGPAFIDGDGNLRIGPWLLTWDARHNALVLRLRERPGQIMQKAHKATLVRTEGRWTVTALATERIRLARR